MKNTTRAILIAVGCALPFTAALAGSGSGSMTGDTMTKESGAKKKMDMNAMQAPKGTGSAEAKGVINKVDTEKGTINVTHEPVPALNWPKMTMDLPVTRRVDLSKIKKGQKIDFVLKQGRDKVFRVTEIKPVK